MYTVTKDFSGEAAKKDIKARVSAIITAALVAEFGAENVANVRVGTASGAKNMLAVRADTVEDEGVFDLCVGVDVGAKEYQDKYSSKTGKLWRTAFDFETAKAAYDAYVADKATKAAENAARKEKKAAADAAARAKAKAAKEAKEAAQTTETE